MSYSLEENVIDVERKLEAKLDESQFDIYINKTQVNVDVAGEEVKFYANVSKGDSNKARLFFYGRVKDPYLLRDAVANVHPRFKLYDNIDLSKTHEFQVTMTGIMYENLHVVINKITESYKGLKGRQLEVL